MKVRSLKIEQTLIFPLLTRPMLKLSKVDRRSLVFEHATPCRLVIKRRSPPSKARSRFRFSFPFPSKREERAVRVPCVLSVCVFLCFRLTIAHDLVGDYLKTPSVPFKSKWYVLLIFAPLSLPKSSFRKKLTSVLNQTPTQTNKNDDDNLFFPIICARVLSISNSFLNAFPPNVTSTHAEARIAHLDKIEIAINFTNFLFDFFRSNVDSSCFRLHLCVSRNSSFKFHFPHHHLSPCLILCRII